MKKEIACDLTVFSKEEKTTHENKSLSILKNARKVTELTDGYSFYHDYSDEVLISIAQWMIDESKCCPFFTFEVALEPIEQGYEISLRLKGSKEVKQFLKSNFQQQFGIKIP